MSDEAKTRLEDLKLITREAVTKTLAPNENVETVLITPGGNMDVVVTGDKDHPVLDLGDRRLEMGEDALQSMGACIGLQKGYVKKCPPEHLFPSLNYWYKDGLSDPIRAIISDGVLLRMTNQRIKSQPVSTERLVTAAETVIGKDNIAGYHGVSSTLDFTKVAIVTTKTFEPKKGDTIFGGISIQNSVIGKEVVEVAPFTLRQWCTNGATTSESLGRYTRKRREDRDNIDDWMSEIIGNASSALDAEFERITHLIEVDVRGHVMEVLNGIRRDYRVPNKIMQEIMDEATSVSPPIETMYDIWNCVTKIATHSESLTPMTSLALQNIAGHVTKQHEVCGACYRKI